MWLLNFCKTAFLTLQNSTAVATLRLNNWVASLTYIIWFVKKMCWYVILVAKFKPCSSWVLLSFSRNSHPTSLPSLSIIIFLDSNVFLTNFTITKKYSNLLSSRRMGKGSITIYGIVNFIPEHFHGQNVGSAPIKSQRNGFDSYLVTFSQTYSNDAS